MLKSSRYSGAGIDLLRIRELVVIALLGVAFAAPQAAHAVEVTALYSAEVLLDPEAEDPRAAAYAAALADVVLRVSGPDLAGDPEQLALLFPEPAAYVVQFRPGADDTLWVSFDGDAVARALRQAGQMVWGAERPLTLVWLAVDWGQGEREIIGVDDPEQVSDESRSIDRYRLLRQRVLDVAERRGLPIVLPLLDTDDLQMISFSDIWGGFDEQLLEASARYDVDSVLVGRIRPGTGQRNRWSYYFGETERVFNGEPELVVDLVADLLAAEFAVSGSAPLETVTLHVAGVDNVGAYGTLHNLLAGISVVESYALVEAVGDQVTYRVESRGGAERLRRALRLDGLIEQEGFDGDRFDLDSGNATLEFFFSPD